MFRDLLPVMNLIMEIMSSFPAQPIGDIVALHREMVRIDSLAWKVGNPPWVRAALAQSDIFLAYWKGRGNGSVVTNNTTQQAYLAFISGYTTWRWVCAPTPTTLSPSTLPGTSRCILKPPT